MFYLFILLPTNIIGEIDLCPLYPFRDVLETLQRYATNSVGIFVDLFSFFVRFIFILPLAVFEKFYFYYRKRFQFVRTLKKGSSKKQNTNLELNLIAYIDLSLDAGLD